MAKESKLVIALGRVKRGIEKEIEELKYVGFDHYIGDKIMGYAHYHKENHTSKNNPFLHSS